MGDSKKRKRNVKDAQIPCPLPDCDRTLKDWSGVRGHMALGHKMSQEEIDQYVPDAVERRMMKMMEKRMAEHVQNIEIEEPEAPSAPRPQRRAKSVTPAVERVVDPGAVSELKGRMRQLLIDISKSTEDQKRESLPLRERIVDNIRELRNPKLHPDRYEEIENRFEDTIRPAVENIHGPQIQSNMVSDEQVTEQAEIDLKKTRVLSDLRALLRDINALDDQKRERLGEEMDTIKIMIRRLGNEEVDKAVIKNVSNQLKNEIRPMVEAITQAKARKRGSSSMGGGDVDEFLDRTVEDMEREYKLTKLNNAMMEQKMNQQKMWDMMAPEKKNGQDQQIPPGMVPKMVPRMIDGEYVRDSQGQIVYDQTYAPPGGQDQGLYQVLAAAIKKPEPSNDMIPLVTAMMNSNAQMITTLMSNMNSNQGTDIEKLMLQLQNENQKFFMELMNNRNNASTEVQGQIDQLRQENFNTQQQMFNQQIGFMNKEMEELRQMAYSDPVARMLQDKERLTALGIVQDGKATVEEATVKEMGNMFNAGVEKVDAALQGFANLIQPLAEAQGELMKQRGQVPVQKKRTDFEKARRYAQLIDRFESMDEGDPQGLPGPEG